MNINSIILILIGSTFGLILRLFIQKNLKINVGFNIQSISIVNFIASFILGIIVASDLNNNDILLFYLGFLGCFSTFTSFIYQLFILFQQRKFRRLICHYFEVILVSFICFYVGFYGMQIIQ